MECGSSLSCAMSLGRVILNVWQNISKSTTSYTEKTMKVLTCHGNKFRTVLPNLTYGLTKEELVSFAEKQSTPNSRTPNSRIPNSRTQNSQPPTVNPQQSTPNSQPPTVSPQQSEADRPRHAPNIVGSRCRARQFRFVANSRFKE